MVMERHQEEEGHQRDLQPGAFCFHLPQYRSVPLCDGDSLNSEHGLMGGRLVLSVCNAVLAYQAWPMCDSLPWVP